MRILLLEPFMGESHQAWAEGYARHSRHTVEIWGLPGRHWKWRMHGAAETYARMYLDRNPKPHLILATDMLDFAGFLALTRSHTATLPTAIYFHENQLTYPWSPEDPDPKLQRDHHYGYINYRSALVADHVLWNSQYNQDSFLTALEGLLRAFPDHQELQHVAAIRSKSQVLPLGMELPAWEPLPPRPNGPPLLLWNHRWEYDKGPILFFETLMELAEEQIPFQLAVVGRSYSKVPPIFAQARLRLERQLIHYGFMEDVRTYHDLLKRSDLLPVTSSQDFFGASVVEAMHFGCVPLLPHALAYPEHVPLDHHPRLLYTGEAAFKAQLRELLVNGLDPGFHPHAWVQRYRWETLAPHYDALLESMVEA